MEPESSDSQAQRYYEKAAAAGLSKITVEFSKKHIINYRTIGRKSEIACKFTYRGSEDQQTVLKSSLTPEELENFDFEQLGPEVGEHCPSFPVFTTADGSERKLDWGEEDEKIYLVDFWATWCQPCLKPIMRNADMVERNQQWRGRVEIIAISVDDTKEEAEKCIQDKHWTQFGSYWCGEGAYKADAPSILRVGGIPLGLLVKRGKILWRGNPSERDLEADINHLLENEEMLQTAQSQDTGPAFTGEHLTHKLAHIESLLSQFIGPSSQMTSPYFVYELTTKATTHGVSYKGLAITGGTYKKDAKEVVEGVVARMKEAFPVIVEKFRFV